LTKFEKLTLLVAFVALLVSIGTASKTFLFNLVGSKSAELSVQREGPISWSFGQFRFTPYFQLHNDGVSEIRPSKVVMTLRMESGETIELIAENYAPSNQTGGPTASELRLSDYIVEPGKILPGTLQFREKQSLAQKDEYEELALKARLSAEQNLRTKMQKNEEVFGKIAQKLLGVDKLSPQQVSLLMSAQGIGAVFAEPDAAFKEAALALFNKSANRFKRGEHKAKVELFDFAGKSISAKHYRFTIFDRDVKTLQESHTGLYNAMQGGPSYSVPTTMPPLLRLNDL
jgi:hypothetical protein